MKLTFDDVRARVRHPLKGLLVVLLCTLGYLLVLALVAAFVNFAMS